MDKLKNSNLILHSRDDMYDAMFYKDISSDEKNDLFQNMVIQHELIQEHRDHTMLQGDQSLNQPSSLRCLHDFKIHNNPINTSFKMEQNFKLNPGHQPSLNSFNLDSSFQCDLSETKEKKIPQQATTGLTGIIDESQSQVTGAKNEIQLQNSMNLNFQSQRENAPCSQTDKEYKSRRNMSSQMSSQKENKYADYKSLILQQYSLCKHDSESRSKPKVESLLSPQKEHVKLEKNQTYQSKYQNDQSIDHMKSRMVSISEFDRSDAKVIQQENSKERKKDVKEFQQNLSGNLLKRKENLKISHKQMSNFEKGIQVILTVWKNQMNKLIRVERRVNQFTELLQIRSLNRKYSNLNEEDFRIIGDKTFFLPNTQRPNTLLSNQQKLNTRGSSSSGEYKATKNRDLIINRIEPLFGYTKVALKFVGYLCSSLSCHKKYKNIIPILMPTDRVVFVWNSLQILFTYLFLYVYSILMFFASKQEEYNIQYLFHAILFLIACDIVVQFHIAYYDKDVIVTGYPKVVKKKIFSRLFLVDVLTLITVLLKLHFQERFGLTYNPSSDIRIYLVNSLIFISLFRLIEKRKTFYNIITFNESYKHLYRLLCQLFNVVFAAHIVCTTWYMIGQLEEDKGILNNWLRKTQIESSSFEVKYIYSFYWAITTMTTVGYGDIVASNEYEALFIAISMILFSCLFAYSINNIGFILQEIEKSSKQLNDQLNVIQRYLNRKNVNISLKSRVRHYLQFLAQEQKNRDKVAEDETLNILTNRLREEITVEINTKIINKFHLFSANFSSKIMKQLVFLMKEVLVSPNEIIFEENSVDDQSIYFIYNGIIEIYINQTSSKGTVQTVLSSLTSDSLFGEISFFSGLSRKASARSVNLSTLYKINRSDFIELLKNSEEDFERFKMLQESILFSGSYKCLFLQCYSCQQYGHLASACPKIIPYVDKQFVTLKYNYSTFQERYYNYRRRNRTFCNKSKQIYFLNLLSSS